MPRLRLSQAARDDLREIRIYSKSAFGARVAWTYLDGLRGVFALLRERPSAEPLEDDLGDRVRGFSYRSHRIYYRVDVDGITIARILHHSRDALKAMQISD